MKIGQYRKKLKQKSVSNPLLIDHVATSHHYVAGHWSLTSVPSLPLLFRFCPPRPSGTFSLLFFFFGFYVPFCPFMCLVLNFNFSTIHSTFQLLFFFFSSFHLSHSYYLYFFNYIWKHLLIT